MSIFTLTQEHDRKQAVALAETIELPATVRITQGVDRSHAQNRLAFKWYKEIAQHSGHSPDHIRAVCKLEIGVPILRLDDEEFRSLYDEMIRPLPYEKKIKLMVEPFDFAVTRSMKTKQMIAYLDGIWQRYAVEGGLALTEPDPMVGDVAANAGAAA